MSPRSIVANLGTRDRRALQLGAWILGPLFVANFVVRPYANALLERGAGLASERALLAREYRAVLALPGDRRALALLDSQLVSIAPRLFDGGDAVTASAELARYVSDIAGDARLHIAQVETETRLDSVSTARPRNERDAPTSNDLRISLRARGDIVAIQEFLRAVESGAKLVRVERLEIVRASDGDVVDGALTFTALISGRARSTLGAALTTEENSP